MSKFKLGGIYSSSACVCVFFFYISSYPLSKHQQLLSSSFHYYVFIAYNINSHSYKWRNVHIYYVQKLLIIYNNKQIFFLYILYICT